MFLKTSRNPAFARVTRGETIPRVNILYFQKNPVVKCITVEIISLKNTFVKILHLVKKFQNIKPPSLSSNIFKIMQS